MRVQRRTVGECMSDDPFTVTPETSVRRAFYNMRFEEVRHMPVVTHDKKLIGIVSDRDLRRPDLTEDPTGWDEAYQLDNDKTVQDIMSTDVKSVQTTDPLEKAAELMITHKFNALPVLNEYGDIVGIISSFDLMMALYDGLKRMELAESA